MKVRTIYNKKLKTMLNRFNENDVCYTMYGHELKKCRVEKFYNFERVEHPDTTYTVVMIGNNNIHLVRKGSELYGSQNEYTKCISERAKAARK